MLHTKPLIRLDFSKSYNYTPTNSLQAIYRLQRVFYCKAHHVLILLLPAFKPNLLGWTSDWYAPYREAFCLERSMFVNTRQIPSEITDSRGDLQNRRHSGSRTSPLLCPVFHKMMQISPPEPSLIMRSSVSRSLARASSGMRLILAFRSSFTSSWRDFPKMLACQILLASPSYS